MACAPGWDAGGLTGAPPTGRSRSAWERVPTFAAVPHGFRPSFRDWCAECTDAPRAVAEQALVHVNTNRVEAWHEGNEPERKNRG